MLILRKKFQIVKFFFVLFFCFCHAEARWDSERIQCKKNISTKLSYCNFVIGTFANIKADFLLPNVQACILAWALEYKKCDEITGIQYTNRTFYFKTKLPEDPNKSKNEKECIKEKNQTLLACYLSAMDRHKDTSDPQLKSTFGQMAFYLCFSLSSPFGCTFN